MIKHLSILLIFFFSTLGLYAEETDSIEAVKAPQIEKVDWRIPAKEKIEKFKADKDFDYGESKTDQISFWERFLKWLAEKMPDFNGINADNVSTFLEVVKFVGIALIIAFLAYIVLRLFGVNFRAIFGKKKVDEKEIDDIEVHTEDVNQMNFQTLISNAIAAKNYRLAIRYTYLSNLKQLSEKSIINWNPTKTNLSYLYEIKDEKLRKEFLRTTYIFDYVWYGEQTLDDAEFNIAYGLLNDFNGMIGNEK